MPHPATEGGACMEKAMSYSDDIESPKVCPQSAIGMRRDWLKLIAA